MNNCLFCKISRGEIPSSKVYEDEKYLAFLDINPVNPGHTLVIPKEHFSNLAETPGEVAAAMMGIVPKLAKAIMAAVGASAFNIALNNGELAGQEVDHVHLHIMPRQEDDGYELWHGKPYESEKEMKKVADLISSKYA